MIDLTPRLTAHARQRCEEMGFSTKRAKRAVQREGVTYPAPPQYSDCFVHVAADDPEIAVCFKIVGGLPLILTVLWNGVEFERPECRSKDTCEAVHPSSTVVSCH